MKSLHWADKYADQIIKKQKKEYLVESGITPSGTVHIGNFREIMTQDLVYKALLGKGVKAKYQYFWDDFDRFRKVPKDVPAEWEEYVGLPVSKTPDPWGCHESYAHHFSEPLIEENKACCINPSYLYASQEYKKCVFAENIEKALERKNKIIQILNNFRAEPLPKTWLPVKVYCEKCGKDTTTVEPVEKYKLKYACECGYENTFDFRKKGIVKLRWRICWPSRWQFYDVDFESSGKDHHASGGSWDTGVAICKEVFEQEPPIGPMYEFVNIKGQTEKMAKSKGNIVTVTDLLDVYEPEVIRYLYTGKIDRAFDVPFDADLLNIYNYYDLAERMYFGKEKIDENERRKYELSQIEKKEYVKMPAFSVCVNDSQIALGNLEKTIEILLKTEQIEKIDEKIIKRIKLAENWVEKYAPEEFKIKIIEEMPKIKIDEKMKEIFVNIAMQIEKRIRSEELQQFIYSQANEKNIPQKTVFATIYKLFLGKERGPRLGPFLVSLEKEFVVGRLKLIK